MKIRISFEHLKNFTTSAKIRYDRKGVDTAMIKNCSRAIFLTNNDIATNRMTDDIKQWRDRQIWQIIDLILINYKTPSRINHK